tara:strand:- start:1021 stop:2397 length:1377 start_codon:yes stop_codon:yes gene_type:complete
MKESKQVRSEHQSFVDAWSKINEHTNSTLATEDAKWGYDKDGNSLNPADKKKKKKVTEKVLVRKSDAFTALAEKYQMVVKQFARYVEANQHLFDIPTRKKAVLANKFQGFKESKEWDEFFGDLELVEEPMVLTKADKTGNTPAWKNRDKKNVKTGEPIYQKADHLKDEDVKVEGEDLQEITTKDTKTGTKFKVRVKDKASNSSYIRFATRDKIAQLRADPKIASVEMTDEGQTPEERGEKKAQAAGGGSRKKASKDHDGDGKIESPKAEYKGSKDKAIKKAIKKRSVTSEQSNWRQDLKEIIGEVGITEGKKSKKKKAKNPVCINPDTDDDKNKYEGYKGTADLSHIQTPEQKKKAEDRFNKFLGGMKPSKKDNSNAKKVAESLGAELKGLEIEDADGNLAFEVVDLIKPDPMKGVSSEEVKLPEIKKDTKFIQGVRKGVLPLEKSKVGEKVKSLPGS